MTFKIQIEDAAEVSSPLRMVVIGGAKSGKTYSAIGIAKGMAADDKIGVIDSENRSSLKAARYLGKFRLVDLPSFHPEAYIAAIHALEKAGMEVIVIDSLSHEWIAQSGAVDLARQINEKYRQDHGKDKLYGGWDVATPLHNAFVQAVVSSPCHIIATVRAETKHLTEKNEKTGKLDIIKVPLQPVQRKDMEYEFDILAVMDRTTLTMHIDGSRFQEIDDRYIEKPGREFGKELLGLITQAGPVVAPARTEEPEPPADQEPPPSEGPIFPQDDRQDAGPPGAMSEQIAKTLKMSVSYLTAMKVSEKGIEQAKIWVAQEMEVHFFSQLPDERANEMREKFKSDGLKNFLKEHKLMG